MNGPIKTGGRDTAVKFMQSFERIWKQHHTKRVQGDGEESHTTRSAEMLSVAAISNKYNLTVIQINVLKLHILSRRI